MQTHTLHTYCLHKSGMEPTAAGVWHPLQVGGLQVRLFVKNISRRHQVKPAPGKKNIRSRKEIFFKCGENKNGQK